MEEKNIIKLIKYKDWLENKQIIIGESIDWFKLGNKKKRRMLKEQGVEIIVIKKKYIGYYFEDTNLFRGNIVLIVLKKKIENQNMLNIMEEIEKELGILLLFIINNTRVLSINYFKNLIKEMVNKETINRLLLNNMKKSINNINIVNKNLIKVISKIKEKCQQ